ncbi:hypothetical protein [Hymenobacter lucidus]|uniref:Uncharacterized protein n=1 Tax=Hymenobacter lucidus TaxID=2880930 RepID=A0ABS8AV77_9BACT|nr:hypothetical protein [Hymenobacter lucidus]MCB2408651.1 hypothetical protein [Hymenobacter lucidus]
MVHVYEQNTVSLLCNRDSSTLRKEARYFARQLRPVLQSTDEYDWIEVEYSTCLVFAPLSCKPNCERTIQLLLRDTTTWATAPLRTTNTAYRVHPIEQWEDQQ